MDNDRLWRDASEESLLWLFDVATDIDATEFAEVGPMPDKAFVLHPLHERLDGKAINDGVAFESDEHGNEFYVDDDDAPEAPERALRWDAYAQRRGITMLRPGGQLWVDGALPGVWTDEFVRPPSEGSLADDDSERALFEVLISHSPDGPDTMCTASYYAFFVGDPRPEAPRPPHVLRGPLGAWAELYNRPGYHVDPHNIWPDDHTWVLGAHVDSWGTAISGSTALIEDVLAAPGLEALRLPHLN